MMRFQRTLALALILSTPALALQRPEGRSGERGEGRRGGAPPPDIVQEVTTEPGIAWYGVLEDARAEAARTGKPILLQSAAPLCSGVPGMW